MPITPCPASPNCVSTEATDARHAAAPFHLLRTDAATWPQIRAAVLELARTRVVEERLNFLRAESHSMLFHFVDVLEVHLKPEAGLLAVRSGARTGYNDFGVNARRVETLRAALQQRGIAR